MKTKLIYLCLGMLALMACKGSGKLQSFIPGTYASFVRGEYSASWDTLVVGDFIEAKGAYPVTRKSTYRRLDNGKAGKLERASEKWLGIWDAETGSIRVAKNLKIIRFNPDSALLLLGTREYRKVGGG